MSGSPGAVPIIVVANDKLNCSSRNGTGRRFEKRLSPRSCGGGFVGRGPGRGTFPLQLADITFVAAGREELVKILAADAEACDMAGGCRENAVHSTRLIADLDAQRC